MSIPPNATSPRASALFESRRYLYPLLLRTRSQFAGTGAEQNYFVSEKTQSLGKDQSLVKMTRPEGSSFLRIDRGRSVKPDESLPEPGR
jgi:hypothetical protein